MTEHPTSHEGRQPLAARPQERTRPRQRDAAVAAAAAATAIPAPAMGSAPAAPDPQAATRREGDRLRFVGAATRRIARGIDLDEIVLGLCRASVPTFSDAILVYLRDPLPVGDERPVNPFVLRLRRSDRLRLTDEETESLSETERLRLPAVDPHADLMPAAELCEVQAGSALAEVLRGVRPVFGDSAAARVALPELMGADRTVPSGHRVILAPLRGRRRVIGAAVFLRGAERPAFEANDLLVAAQLATHTALGIDKAVLYGREAYIADELQRTMLPDSLPQPTGVKLASRYLPAAETARVGGDWYDAIPLPGSRVALVVGDVMGHSMTSAAIMGQLRTTAQTLAGLDLPRRRSCTTSTSRPSGSAATAWPPASTRCTTRSRTASPSPTPATRRPSCSTWAAVPRCCGCPRAPRSASEAWTSRPSSWTHRPERRCCCTPTAWSSHGCGTSGRASSSCASGWPRPPG